MHLSLIINIHSSSQAGMRLVKMCKWQQANGVTTSVTCLLTNHHTHTGWYALSGDVQVAASQGHHDNCLST